MSGEAPKPTPVQWRADGAPQSALYGDVYFSSDDGLAESRAVYLNGCGLPQGWAGRSSFTVAELGFGTGLNIAALLTLWRETRPSGGHLHIFSVEAHLMPRDDAARALARWPSIAPAAQALLTAWPPATPLFHRFDLPDFDATLDLAVMDAAQALALWNGRADAWLLDGFSPALNPAMWSPELMLAVAERSAPGARAATFTVAGSVRQALADAGFAVERCPGFGRKRQRLEAILPGLPTSATAPKVAVIGAGIAGASLMRALSAIGLQAVLFETDAPGAGASGNPAALVMPGFDAGEGPRARLFAHAQQRATALYGQVSCAVIGRGALQLETTERDPARFEKVVVSPLFVSLSRLSPQESEARLCEPAVGGLAIADAIVVDPAAVLSAWACGERGRAVADMRPDGAGWRLIGAEDQDLGVFEAVVLATGADLGGLWPGATVQSVRGQTSWTAEARPPMPAAFGGYVIPTPDGGLLFGATHDRGDTDETLRLADHDRNLALLAKGMPVLAAKVASLPLQGRARRRAATPDRMPLAGAVPDKAGLYVLGCLGSRGFCTAPLLAEHLAALIAGAPSPLPNDEAALVDPARL